MKHVTRTAGWSKTIRRARSGTKSTSSTADSTVNGPNWEEAGDQFAPTLRDLRPALKAANGHNDHYGSGTVTEAEVTFDDFTIVEVQRQRQNAGVYRRSEHDDLFTIDLGDALQVKSKLKILNKESFHVSIEDGLAIVTQYGKLGDRVSPLKNLALLNEQLPTDDWDLEVQAVVRLTSQHNNVGIVLYQDPKNVIEIGKLMK